MTGGTVAIDSCDDSIHSNDTVRISGGVIQVSSGDDGVHADAVLEISGGKVTIAESYEGLEAASVELTGGEIELRASDDGINAAGGSDGSQQSGPFGARQLCIAGGRQPRHQWRPAVRRRFRRRTGFQRGPHDHRRAGLRQRTDRVPATGHSIQTARLASTAASCWALGARA